MEKIESKTFIFYKKLFFYDIVNYPTVFYNRKLHDTVWVKLIKGILHIVFLGSCPKYFPTFIP